MRTPQLPVVHASGVVRPQGLSAITRDPAYGRRPQLRRRERPDADRARGRRARHEFTKCVSHARSSKGGIP
jgi:hypothetical protein